MDNLGQETDRSKFGDRERIYKTKALQLNHFIQEWRSERFACFE